MAKKSNGKAILNPQQSRFLAAYLNPASPTHGNGYQSAIEAGYREEYAKTITAQMPEWLSENIKTDKSSAMLAKAERNLEAFLDWDTTVPAIGAFGPIMEKVIDENGVETKVPVYKTNTEMLKIKSDVTKFVAERLGKAKYGTKADAETAPPQVIHYNLFYNPQFQSTLRTAEGEIKKLIEHAQPTQEN